MTNDLRVEILFKQRASRIRGLETGAEEFVINRLH
jgi:hypothetical protein